jgi:hypothetical protein
MPLIQTRRRLLTAMALAIAGGLLRGPRALAADGVLETTTVRLVNDGSICIAPEYAAEDLLRAEGFTDIRYLPVPQNAFEETMARGEVDFSTDYARCSFISGDPDPEGAGFEPSVPGEIGRVFVPLRARHLRFKVLLLQQPARAEFGIAAEDRAHDLRLAVARSRRDQS